MAAILATDRGARIYVSRRNRLERIANAEDHVGQDLDGHLPFELGIFGLPEDAQAALPDLLDEAVMGEHLSRR